MTICGPVVVLDTSAMNGCGGPLHSTELHRCRQEIAQIEALLRDGHTDMHGLLLALQDWSQELRLLESAL